MRERWLWCAVGLGLSALAGPLAGDDTPVFRSGAELVVLDLVARDHRGALVRDLRADEIEVYEDGERQQALEFRFVAPEGEPLAVAPTAPSFAVAGSPLAAAGRPSRRPDLVALVFDQISAEGRALALQAGRGFLESQRGDGAYLAVFRIDRPLRMASGFTREPEALRDAIEAAALGSTPAFVSGVAGISAALSGSRNAGDPRQAGFDSRELRPAHSAHDADAGTPMDGDGPLAAERNIANVTADILRTAEDVERTQRGNAALDGLLAVVHGLRTLPGRKTLVYFSEGLHVPSGLEDPFRALVSEANRVGVSIYTVDVRGLGAVGPMADAREMLEQAVSVSRSQRLSGSAWYGVTREQAREFETVETSLRVNARGTLEDLAKGTGGFLIAEGNDLGRKLQRLGEDVRHYYEIGYAPVDRRLDGRFRSVSVRVKRPGVTLQSRAGYFAIPHAVAGPLYGFEGPLLGALAARRPSRDVDHSPGLFRFDADGSGVRHALAVAVPLARVAFRRDERLGRYAARVSVLALVRDARGDVVEKLSQDYLLEGPLAELAATRSRRVTFARAFRLRPGRYSVDAAVRDGFADRIGCSRLELPVAAPAPGLRLSSVVPIAAVSPASGATDAVGDPFRVGELRLTPALPAALAREPGQDQLALYFVVYAPSGGAPPALQLEVSRDGRVVRRGALTLPAADANGRIEHVARIPLGTLAPGLYSVRLIVSEGAASAAEETTVRLAAGGD